MIKQEKSTGDIVINGFQNGIGDSPYDGIGDLKNINITSIPNEASVNFATSQISPPTIPVGTVTSVSSNILTYTGATGLENYMCISFSASTMGSVSINTPYWITNLSGGTFTISDEYSLGNTVAATSGIGTFNVITVAVNYSTGTGGFPKFFTYDEPDSAYFMLTSTGDLWSNIKTTTSGYWTFCGNSRNSIDPLTGAGLAYYQSFDDSNSYIFVFRNSSIDYFRVRSGGVPNLGWVHNWNPLTGNANYGSATLNSDTSVHNAYVGQDNVLYWCDGHFIGSLFETPDGPPQTIVFDPSSTATFTYAKQALALPVLDNAQCLAELGINLLIGGQNNAIYPWNRTSTSFSYPILLAEYNVKNIVTVNTSSYIFCGNRGRIYITNGSQAQLYKKIPDFLSQTVEPYYTWGGACSNKNQLYFSFNETTNANGALTLGGGVWAIDLNTKTIRLANTLSYQTTTYQGYSRAMIQNFASAPAGTGLYIGWSNTGTPLAGIDTTTSAPYAGGTAVAKGIVVSDLIPIGTFLKPITQGRIEFKLAVPMVANESVQLFYRQKLSDSFTNQPVGSAITTATQGFNGYSWAYTSVPFQNSQWIQIQAVLISTASSPSYCRLTEMRISSM